MSWAVSIRYTENPFHKGRPWVVIERRPDGTEIVLGSFKWSWEAIERANS